MRGARNARLRMPKPAVCQLEAETNNKPNKHTKTITKEKWYIKILRRNSTTMNYVFEISFLLRLTAD